MTEGQPAPSGPMRWETFRFSVVGPLLAAPPEHGDLRRVLEELAAKAWRHPVTGALVRFSFATIERWFYRARRARVDPVGALQRKVRTDLGQQTAMPEVLRESLNRQYCDHPAWSYQLHADNLAVVATEELKLTKAPSYSTVRRYLKANGLVRQRHRGPAHSPGAERAEARFRSREVRSYESTHVHALWHADYHHGRRKVLTADGLWVTPLLLGILEDRSRLCCHLQWYLHETAETFVHGLCQALQKRALPRALMTDNGSAMVAAETENGLARLSITHATTLPYSPEQNAKQEKFWAQIEGRLMPMLEGVDQLTLALLNQSTQAWVELEYNRSRHSEIGEPPLARFLAGPDLGRPAPGSDELRRAFSIQTIRQQRHTDGTLTLDGVRFEVPNRYRHLDRLTVRYARWDLAHVWLFDPRTQVVLCPIYPLDKERKADGLRRSLDPIANQPLPQPPTRPGMAPLLKKMMADWAALGLPPAYLPKPETCDPEVDHG